MRDENAGPRVDRLPESLTQAFERTGLERERFAVAIDAPMSDDRVLSLDGRGSHGEKCAAARGASQLVLVTGSKR